MVERNVYLYKATCQLVETRTDVPSIFPKPTIHTAQSKLTSVILEPSLTRNDSVNPTEPKVQSSDKCICKLSHHLHNILEGHGTSSYWPSAPILTCGVQLPTAMKPNAEVLEGEGSESWMMVANAGDEYVLVVETSEIEAIKP